MDHGYTQIGQEINPDTGYSITNFEKPVNGFILKLKYFETDSKSVDIDIERDNERIGFIRSVYWPSHELLFIEDIDTHIDHRRKGLGRLRMKEVISFLNSKGETPKKIIAEEVGYLGTPDGSEFFKTLGFQPVEKSTNWKASIEDLKKSLGLNS